MKIRILILSVCILMLSSVLLAQEMVPLSNLKEQKIEFKSVPLSSNRTVPQFTFTRKCSAIQQQDSSPIYFHPDSYFFTYFLLRLYDRRLQRNAGSGDS